MGKETLSKKLISIIGPRRLQNELMASFLEQETGTKCEGHDDIRPILDIDDGDAGQSRLILFDCLGKDLDSCRADFESFGERMLSRDQVALFNVSPSLDIEEKAIVRGIKGFFYEQEPLEHFPKGVRAIFNGELWVSREIMTKCILEVKGHDSNSKKDLSTLTRREIEILSMLAVGATNEEIAEALFISPNTVKTHIYNIFKKIHVPNRLQAALWAAKNL